MIDREQHKALKDLAQKIKKKEMDASSQARIDLAYIHRIHNGLAHDAKGVSPEVMSESDKIILISKKQT